ncbi:MAG TPA: hypothetical protein VK509_02830 [Polyangiales bacterium]|nr:hypothetical protein [Polyangiales bacterium]
MNERRGYGGRGRSRWWVLAWVSLLCVQCTELGTTTESPDAGDAMMPDDPGARGGVGAAAQGGAGGVGGRASGGSGGDPSLGGVGGVGGDGTGGVGGDGTGGVGGDGTGGAGGEACSTEGELRCSAGGAGAREICQAGFWRAGEACASGAVCVAADPMQCQSILELCIGSAGQAVCSGADLVPCDAQGIAGAPVTCRSAQLCELGKATGACALCLDGEHHCSELQLQVCAQGNASWQDVKPCDTAALCNEAAGDCTTAACSAGGHCDGATRQHCNATRTGYDDVEECNAGLCDQANDQCDVCVPGAGRCVGNTSYVCASDGQREVSQVCSKLCAGAGKCVACIVPGNCDPPSNQCQVATCDAMGMCGATSAPQNASCPTGLCDGQGNCRCRDTADCHSASLVCISGTCATNTCGDGVMAGSEECDLGASNSNTGACTKACKNARCGDGYTRPVFEECDDGVNSTTGACPNCKTAKCNDGFIRSGSEECDPRAAGWNLNSCSNPGCKRILYTDCMQSTECSNAYSCDFGGCTPSSICPGGTCPTIPGWTSAVCGGLGGSCLLKCPSNSCPAGLVCSDLGDGNGPVCHINQG